MGEIQQFLSQIDYGQLFGILLPTTVMCYAYNLDKYQINQGGDSLNKYSIKNDFNGIFRKRNREENKRSFSERFANTVNNFSKTIEEKSSNINLAIFYKNLQSLKIKESNFSVINILNKNTETLGEYNNRRNSIRINKGEESNSLNHELLHMASTIKNGNLTFSGFKQGNVDFKNLKASCIGNAFNEGYTELLAERYFGQGNEYREKKHYASLVEKIVGKEKMEQLYFSADLNGLIEELEHYESKDNIINFLDNLDYLNENLYYDIKDQDVFDCCSKCFEECSVFVLKCFSKKIYEQCGYGLLSTNEANFFMKDYLDSLFDFYPTNKGEIYTISQEKIVEAVSDLFTVNIESAEDNNNKTSSR